VTTTNKIYAANLHSWSLTAIRGSDHTPLANVYVGVQPCKAAADAADARVYISNHLEGDNGVAAVDSHTDERIYYYSRMHAVPGRYGIDVDPARDQLFIAARDGGLIAIQDAYAPDQEPQLFKLDPPRVPFVVAFNPTTEHLLVTAADDNLVVVLEPYSIQWNRGRWIIYRDRPVFLLDRENAGWIAEIGVGSGAEEGIAVNPSTGYVYVSNAGSDTLSVIQDAADPADIRWIVDIPVGEVPQGVAVDVVRNLVYVGNAGSRTLSVIDGATHSVVKTIPLE
jgi:YVTN family beta-propeller protein